MDPIILILLVIFVLLVLFAIWQSREQNPAPADSDKTSVPDDSFDFDEDTENLTPTVRRKIRIVAPAQRLTDGNRKLRLTAGPLPNLAGVTPPPEKGIDAILVAVLNPSARLVGSDEAVYEFDPPLTLIVNYKPEDRDATTLRDGVPQLSLATVYETENGWRFERLPTTVKPNGTNRGGTLTASLKTLQPKDPVVMCRP